MYSNKEPMYEWSFLKSSTRGHHDTLQNQLIKLDPIPSAWASFSLPPAPSLLTMMIEVSSAVLAVIMMKLSMKHVYQITPLLTPMVLRVSLRRNSFSSTIPFTVMDTE